jgi:hypothetical protein
LFIAQGHCSLAQTISHGSALTSAEGRALFKEFTKCPTILSGVRELYDHIRCSGDRSKLDGYLLHSHRFPDSSTTRNFWQLQASIIKELLTIRSLSMFIAFVHPDHDGRPVSLFSQALQRSGWVISDTALYFPDFGDSVAGSSRVIIGVHSDTDSSVEPCPIPTPPSTSPAPLSTYIWAPFNTITYAISRAPSSDKFNEGLSDSDSLLHLDNSSPKHNATSPQLHCSKTLYCLHRHGSDPSIQTGAQVVSHHHICPVVSQDSSVNVFGRLFGIEFTADDDTFVRPLSLFEFVRCFNLTDDLTYKLSHPSNESFNDAAIPAFTSASIFQACHSRLTTIRDANLQLYEPNITHAPAAMANVFINGTIGSRLPDHSKWVSAYDSDPSCRLIKD